MIKDLYYQNSLLRITWANWLNKWDWEWFVTLTFKYSVTLNQAERYWRKWVRKLNSKIDDQIGYFRVTELQQFRYVPHFHTLILNTKNARRLTLMDCWDKVLHAGYARIYSYEKDKGAAYYLTKNIVNPLGDYKFGGCILKT